MVRSFGGDDDPNTIPSSQVQTNLSNPRTPEEKKTDPSHSPHGSQGAPKSHSGQPNRAEITVPESTRARYKKALQPCTSRSMTGKDGHGKSPALSANADQAESFDGLRDEEVPPPTRMLLDVISV